jgi:hypothetical protein
MNLSCRGSCYEHSYLVGCDAIQFGASELRIRETYRLKGQTTRRYIPGADVIISSSVYFCSCAYRKIQHNVNVKIR